MLWPDRLVAWMVFFVLLLGHLQAFPRSLCSFPSHRLLQLSSTRTSHTVTCLSAALKVALTREKGTNSKLETLLPDFHCVEIPCIAFQREPGADQIVEAAKSHDIVIITSPQAAEVFLEAWDQGVDLPTIKIVTVGKGTSKPLIAKGLKCVFEPSEATAKCLASELPMTLGRKVLYPCSAIASDTLASDLTARGFDVTRLETYRTVPATWTDAEYELAKSVDMVTFASPSAAKIWKERVGTHQPAVTVGPTSEKAAKEAGFTEVFSPSEGSQGIEVWAKLVYEIASQLFK